MSRRALLTAVLFAGAACLALVPYVADISPVNGQIIRGTKTGDLKQQLKVKLRPRSPEEFAFIDRVVLMVERGQLPLRTVQSTFNWARRLHRRYKFPYFKRAVQIEAAKLGIKVR